MFTKKIWGKLLAAAVVFGLVTLAIPQTTVQAAVEESKFGPGGWNDPGRAPARGSSTTLTPLAESEAQALRDAILEEYGALNLYQAVIDQFGEVAPFTRIVLSEQQHVDALVRQANKYGVDAPANPGLVDAPEFADLAAACQAGVDAEIADAALYDELMIVTTHADLIRVYTRLQSASLESHLPAFETCDWLIFN